MSDPAVRELIEDCGFECFGDNDISSCAASCVERDTGLTTGCSICFGELTECTITHCFNECAQGTDTTACRECQDMFCTVDFETCSGITAP